MTRKELIELLMKDERITDESEVTLYDGDLEVDDIAVVDAEDEERNRKGAYDILLTLIHSYD